MVHEIDAEGSEQQRVREYLGNFKSKAAATGAGITLEDYLLERAAEELRAATEDLDRLDRDLGGD
jgi:hypothetical protein